MKNDFIVDGNLVYITVVRRNKERAQVIINLSKLEELQKINCRWYLDYRPKSKNYYVATQINKKKHYLHRLITNPSKGMVVDHINSNTLDNRMENLRNCSHVLNSQNRLLNQNNTSGKSGVSWYKTGNKWRAYITPNRKQIHLGYFKTKEEAENAVIEAKRLNMPFSKELYG
jgi:hypothetical protein